jgi:uncharacterized membrane protein YesL
MGKNKREFGEGPVYTITNYLTWGLMGNIYFALVNIPLIITLLAIIGEGKKTIPQGVSIIGYICCIPIGPASVALYSSMGKLVRERDVNITRDFFKAYKINFFQSIFLSALEIILLAALYTDTKLVEDRGLPSILSLLLYVLIIFVIMMGFNMLPILSRFYLKSKDIIRLSAYYTIRKFNITILNLAILVMIGYIFLKVFPLIIVFIPSIFCYLIMLNEEKVLAEIEENLKTSDDMDTEL